MYRNFLTSLVIVSFALVGCTRDDELKREHKNLGDNMAATQPMADACPMCPGDQVATADGRCPTCGMKVR